MPTNICRICGKDFFEQPLLYYENMPKSAQNFPDKTEALSERGTDLTVCQCSGCGLVQLNNDPVPYYREVIRAAGISEVIKKLKTEQFAEFIERFSLQSQKVIEIGCGCGEFLSLLEKLPVEAYGLEYSESSVAQCITNGLKVSRGYLEQDVKLSQGPFSAFILLMFLEHMPNPNSTLQGIYHHLTDDGVGLIEVPNFNMMLHNKLFSEFIGDHLFYFSRETLHTTLNLNGFEVLECSEIRDDYVISAIVRKRKKLDISDFYDYQTKITTRINEYIDRFTPGNVAVWGAGHQALAIISMCKIASKIKYVVDSAPFKQGKLTPATHIPVVSPDTLCDDPVDAVIIMAASYSDEVAGILHERFKDKFRVAILREAGLEIIN